MSTKPGITRHLTKAKDTAAGREGRNRNRIRSIDEIAIFAILALSMGLVLAVPAHY